MIIRIRQIGKDYDRKNRYIYAINKSKNDYRWTTSHDGRRYNSWRILPEDERIGSNETTGFKLKLKVKDENNY